MTTPTRIATGLAFSILLISGCGKASPTTAPAPPVTEARAPTPSSPATAAPAPAPVPPPAAAPTVPGRPTPTVGVEHDLAQIENDLNSADQDLRLSTTPNQPSTQGE